MTYAGAVEATPVPRPTRRLRIAMIGLRGIPATYGGVERAVEELSAHLVERGHEVTVYARSAYSDANVSEHRGVEVVRLPQVNTKHLEAASHSAVALGHALVARRFDLIHLHATGPGALSPLPRLVGTPTVVTVQGLDWRREKWGPAARTVLQAAAALSARSPDRTIVVSRELKRYFAEHHGVDPVYIPNGVHEEPDEGVPPDPDLEPDRFVLFLGRLVREKHVHTLIRAYRRVEGDLPLVIAGPQSHSPEYLAELRALAAGDPRIRLLGAQYGPNKTWLMRNALAFVQPSSIEGLPIALLEALSAGRYPIVSSIPENLEPVTVGDETLGATTRVGDEQELAHAIAGAIAAPDRAAVGRRLRDHVREAYDWGSIAAATEATYRDALREHRGGRFSVPSRRRGRRARD
jgi:glycosyltransferase involved in cell wall biosynthesis